MRQERQEKVWSLRSSIKGRRRRRQEEKANAGAGKGLRQGELKEGGGEGEGQHTGVPRHRGGDPGDNKEGAKGREAKQWGKDSAGEYQRPVQKGRSKDTLDDKRRAWVGAVERA